MIHIDSGYFVAGAVMENDVCVRVAPIIKYMKGWNTKKIYDYIAKKDWLYYDDRETIYT